MTAILSDLRWRRIVPATLAAFVGSMLVTIAVVTGYASKLAGRPIPCAFRRSPTLWLRVGGPVLLALFTLAAAFWAARRVTEPIAHGVVIGSIAAISGLIPSWPPDVRDALFFVAVLCAGWAGGVIAQRSALVKPC